MTKNKITAVLGPTNTGKTFQAIEIMLGFETGMIGFPLRLLAREVYDKVIKKIDPPNNNFRLIWSANTPIKGPNKINGSIQRIGIAETRRGEPVISKE